MVLGYCKTQLNLPNVLTTTSLSADIFHPTLIQNSRVQSRHHLRLLQCRWALNLPPILSDLYRIHRLNYCVFDARCTTDVHIWEDHCNRFAHPVRLSVHAINISCMPRFFSSVKFPSQNLAPHSH